MPNYKVLEYQVGNLTKKNNLKSTYIFKSQYWRIGFFKIDFLRNIGFLDFELNKNLHKYFMVI
ncbi:hypothetical protein AGMMS49953_06070 [Endomicrobiia bacterium]|nr:hypothetical protein AGMMS49953_06070 [Endomicrobiia bacterium]